MDPSQLSLADVGHHAEESYLNILSGETDINFSPSIDYNNVLPNNVDYSSMPAFNHDASITTMAPLLNQGFRPPLATGQINTTFQRLQVSTQYRL